MSTLRPVRGASAYRYSRLIGTGGIGSGLLFKLSGNHTLGRDESRLGELTDAQDYCKLHIICHYPAVLLGTGGNKDERGGFEVIPVGKVGDDAEGEWLLRQLRAAGMSTEQVGRATGARTLFSVCFQYPDSAGGNITSTNGASGLVEPADIERAFAALPGRGHGGGTGGIERIEEFGKAGEIALAAPEVPLAARLRLLELGKARGCFTAASVLASEVAEFERLGGLELTDLLAVNMEEARVLAGLDAEGGAGMARREESFAGGASGPLPAAGVEANSGPSRAAGAEANSGLSPAARAEANSGPTPAAGAEANSGPSLAAEADASSQRSAAAELAAGERFPAAADASSAAASDGSRAIAARCADALARRNPRAMLVVTDGAAGCYSYACGELIHTPPLRVDAAGTAGAGDAMLAGILCGLSCGLPFAKRRSDPHFDATPLASAVELGTLLAALAVTSPHSIHPNANGRSLAGFAREHGLAFGEDFACMLSACQS